MAPRRTQRTPCVAHCANHLRPVLRSIPPDAATLELPHLGKVIYFREGAEWRAVWPDFVDVQTSPVGFGLTPGEAVAELVTLQR